MSTGHFIAEKRSLEGIYRFFAQENNIRVRFSNLDAEVEWNPVDIDMQALAQTLFPQEVGPTVKHQVEWLLDSHYLPQMIDGRVQFIRDPEVFEKAYTACQEKNITALGFLNPQTLKNIEGRSLLQEAIERNESSVAKWLIQENIALDIRDQEENTALHYAAKHGKLDLIELLWSKGIALKHVNVFNQTALHVSAQHGQTACVEALLLNGASPLAKGTWAKRAVFNELTPLAFAIIEGTEKTIALFLSQLAKENKNQLKCGKFGTILHLAIHFSRYDLISYLFDAHGDTFLPLLEKKNEREMTPFMLAASLGEKQILYLLKAKGANIEATDFQENRAMHYAARENNIETLTCLFSLGCQLDPVNKEGQTPTSILPPQSQAIGLLNNFRDQKKVISSKPPSFSLEPPENLVFKGGGPKGIAYVGAVEALETKKMLGSLKRVAGTSAGAINACLMALGYQSKEMEDILFKTDLKTFLDHPLTHQRIQEAVKDTFGGVGKTLKTLDLLYKSIKHPLSVVKEAFQMLWHTTGVCNGKVFENWIEQLIQNHSGIPYCTFGDLRRKIERGEKAKNGAFFRHLYVYTTCLKSKETIFCIDSENKKWDNIIISDAIRASMSIPGVFKPHILHAKNENGDKIKREDLGFFADGGMLYNFPLEAFDKKKYQTHGLLNQEEGEYHQLNKKTLGFELFSPDEKQKNLTSPPKIETVGDLLSSFTQLYLSAEDNIRQLTPYNKHRIIPISNEGVGTLEFSLSDERKKLLITSGITGTENFVEKQNNYIRQLDSLFLLPSPQPKQPAPPPSKEIVQDTHFPSPHQLKMGMNLEIICKTGNCFEKGKRQLLSFGFGKYNVAMKTSEARCGACHEKATAIHLIFWKCHYKVQGATQEKPFEKSGIVSKEEEGAAISFQERTFIFMQVELNKL